MKFLGAAEATSINDTIKSSLYSANDNEQLQAAVDSKIQCSNDTQKKTNKYEQNGKQFLRHIWNYPTQGDWDILLDNKKGFSA